MTKTTNNTKADTSVQNLSRLTKIAAEMKAQGNHDGAQAIMETIWRALGVA